MPRPSQKDKILQAALECFAELGYDATRVRHVAERANVSEAALYRHYRSMEALAQELYAHHFAEFAARLQEATSVGKPEDRLRQAVRTALAAYRADPAAFITTGQDERTLRGGQSNLLAAIFLGCILQPTILASLAAPGHWTWSASRSTIR